jgi:hypothetical protein
MPVGPAVYRMGTTVLEKQLEGRNEKSRETAACGNQRNWMAWEPTVYTQAESPVHGTPETGATSST